MPPLAAVVRRLLLALTCLCVATSAARARAQTPGDPPLPGIEVIGVEGSLGLTLSTPPPATVPSVDGSVIVVPSQPPASPLQEIPPGVVLVVPGLPDPTLVSPACGTQLGGTAQRVEWTGPGSAFRLTVGTSRGLADLFDSGRLDGASGGVDVPDLPVDGRTLHVRLRWLDASNTWQRRDCTVSAASLPRPTLVAPVCGTALAGAGARFGWAANGWPVTAWRLRIGAARGAAQYFDSGVVAPDVLAVDVTTLPGDGSPVHARLSYRTRIGGWKYADCSFVAATLTAPALVLPACGSALTGPDATFAWGANGWAIAAWRLRIGSAPGGNDLFDSGKLAADVTALDLTGLPRDGETLHVRLGYLPFGFPKWLQADCTVAAASLPKPALTGPACGGSLTGTRTAFAWDDAGRAAEGWRLTIGSSVGGAEFYDSGRLGAAARSIVANGLPHNGRTVQARLRWLERGAWKRVDCPYTAFAGRVRTALDVPYTHSYTSTCSGSGTVFAMVSPCTRSCPGKGSIDVHLDERGSATPPAPPAWDLNGVWSGGVMASTCPDYYVAMNRFVMEQAGTSLSGRLVSDAGVAELSGGGCSYSCSAPGACRFRCSDGSTTLDCNVTCSPATTACRSEYDVTGTSSGISGFSLSGQRSQRITFQCGRGGSVTVQEQQGFDLRGAFPLFR